MRKTSLMSLAPSLLLGLSTSGGLDDGKPKTGVDFCGEFAKRECEPTAAVCSRETKECEPIRRATCQASVAPLEDATRRFRPDNAEECLEQLEEVYKKNLITAADLDALYGKCLRVVEGSGVANARCSIDQDCRSPLVCDKSLCGPPRVVAAGANCANPGETCQPSEFCKPADGIAVCSARADKGTACSAALPCKPNLRCDGSTCVDKLAANAACAGDDDCLSGYCNPYPPTGVGRTCLPGLSFAPFAPSCEAYFGPST
jgi:hypothetical protein